MAELYHYRCRMLRVVDGDTFDVELDLGFHVKMERRARMLGYNSPEIFGGHFKTPMERELGLACKTRLEALLKAEGLIVRTELDSSDKYGRILVEVISAGTSINPMLREEANSAWSKLRQAYPAIYKA